MKVCLRAEIVGVVSMDLVGMANPSPVSRGRDGMRNRLGKRPVEVKERMVAIAAHRDHFDSGARRHFL